MSCEDDLANIQPCDSSSSVSSVHTERDESRHTESDSSHALASRKMSCLYDLANIPPCDSSSSSSVSFLAAAKPTDYNLPVNMNRLKQVGKAYGINRKEHEMIEKLES